MSAPGGSPRPAHGSRYEVLPDPVGSVCCPVAILYFQAKSWPLSLIRFHTFRASQTCSGLPLSHASWGPDPCVSEKEEASPSSTFAHLRCLCPPALPLSCHRGGPAVSGMVNDIMSLLPTQGWQGGSRGRSRTKATQIAAPPGRQDCPSSCRGKASSSARGSLIHISL